LGTILKTTFQGGLLIVASDINDAFIRRISKVLNLTIYAMSSFSSVFIHALSSS